MTGRGGLARFKRYTNCFRLFQNPRGAGKRFDKCVWPLYAGIAEMHQRHGRVLGLAGRRRFPRLPGIVDYGVFTVSLGTMAQENVRKHEVAFCAEVSKWADRLFEARSDLPFGSSDIESFGRGSQKRQDFRVYARGERGRGPLALCGEVKLPGNPQARSPFDPIVMLDAFNKATAENCQYFFTWNVEHLALFDRSLWDRETMHERCIGEWKLGLQLDKSTDVARPEVEAKIRDEFLPKFFADFAEIKLGRRASFTELPSDLYISILESHLAGPMGPVRETRDYLALKAATSTAFDARLRTANCLRQPQRPRPPLHRLDAKADVRAQIDAQIGCSLHNIFAMHAARESLVLHLFLHAWRFPHRRWTCSA